MGLQLLKSWTLRCKLVMAGKRLKIIKISANKSLSSYELKKQQRNYDKLQWLQDTCVINWNNLNNIRREEWRFLGCGSCKNRRFGGTYLLLH
jgi:hypothetical protein